MNNEERIVSLETRMSYAEDTVNELNKTIASQNHEIDNLRKFCSELQKKIEDLKESAGESMGFDRPPHY